MKRKGLGLMGFLLLTISLAGFTLDHLPQNPRKVVAADMDNDGDLDLVIGHNIADQENQIYGVISLYLNNGIGEVVLQDSLRCHADQLVLEVGRTHDSPYPEIITHWRDPETSFYGIAIIQYYPEQNWNPVTLLSTNIFRNDGMVVTYSNGQPRGIGFYCNHDQLWGFNCINNGVIEPSTLFPLSFSPVGISSSDIDRDGQDEIIVFGSETGIYDLDSLPTSVIPLDEFSQSALVCDLDGDQDLDIVFLALFPSGEIAYYLEQTETMSFSLSNTVVYDNESPFWPSFAADIDHDSYIDAIGASAIYEQEAPFSFVTRQDFPIPVGYRAFAYADMDGNGCRDIIRVGDTDEGHGSGWLQILFDHGNGDYQDEPVTVQDTPTDSHLSQITVFPNPSRTRVQLSLTLHRDGPYSLALYNVKGQQMLSRSGYMRTGTSQLILPLKDLPSGLYLMRFEAEGRESFTKMVIMK
jgi:hypothetical protein